MYAMHPRDQSARQRLQHAVRYNASVLREGSPPQYPTAIGLLLIILGIVCVAVVGGSAITDFFRAYTLRIHEWSLPLLP